MVQRSGTMFGLGVLIREAGLPGKPGSVYTGSFEQLGVQAVGVLAAFVSVFTLSYITFAAIKAVFGLRVTEDEETQGREPRAI
jgi:Amt family ammonium transporter